ncbi:tRNA (guanosine(37)-N1)-methyltransferase TrmD [Corynebacterium tapiri]|uniref:tRNA (guanine-N(1)-)-methyltransferase n=1 Tax=Corynebacterium tapiri TaxID=1448266 RepID=A0A5C4U6L8_9CORY|nr:tRNA (guanosine(37)-N1)-methyltransferase TrmD [Corynebacterium tapiri]TNL99305.1 tRNA (guanosine(37)-N1)-methyltransferase TrmD [Corynebacterium tapiri]
MRIDVLTIFPEYLEPMRHALLGKAIEDGHLTVHVHNFRDWATDTHQSVDGRPAGGGPGMVLKPEVVGAALDDVATLREGTQLGTAAPHRSVPRHDDLTPAEFTGYEAAPEARPLLIIPTPSGKPFTQEDAQAFSAEEHVVFACGRYEGIDQRVIDDAATRYRVREVSIGDYVLIGGEVAVLVMVEAFARLIPGVLGNSESHLQDSFSDGLLEGPCYTKPRQWRGREIPEVLLSGDHGRIERYRRDQALLKTQLVRPELLDAVELSAQDKFVLYARPVRTRLNVEMSLRDWSRLEPRVAKKLKKAGYLAEAIQAAEQDNACTPDNMFGAGNTVLNVVVEGTSALPLEEATSVVVRALGQPAQWYGTTVEAI